jgi:hypothetical protein
MEPIPPPQHVVTLPVAPWPTVAVSTSDPAIRAEHLPHPGSFRLQGVAEGTLASQLQVEIDGFKLEIPLSRGMGPTEVFEAVGQRLPHGYSSGARPDGQGVIVTVRRVEVPPAKVPVVTAIVNDAVQHVRMLAQNKFELSGVVANNGVVQSSALIEIDGRRVMVLLSRGMTPMMTARAIEVRLPRGYGALVETSRHHGDPAVMTIVHDAGIRAAAA